MSLLRGKIALFCFSTLCYQLAVVTVYATDTVVIDQTAPSVSFSLYCFIWPEYVAYIEEWKVEQR